MIGDWVCYNKPNGYVTQVQEVRHTSDGEEWYITCNRDKRDPLTEKAPSDSFNVEILSEIPITEEILETNGFQRSGSNFLMSDDYFDIIIDELTDSIWDLQYTNCEMDIGHQQMCFCHVHELQHALRMCGMELEIKL